MQGRNEAEEQAARHGGLFQRATFCGSTLFVDLGLHPRADGGEGAEPLEGHEVLVAAASET